MCEFRFYIFTEIHTFLYKTKIEIRLSRERKGTYRRSEGEIGDIGRNILNMQNVSVKNL